MWSGQAIQIDTPSDLRQVPVASFLTGRRHDAVNVDAPRYVSERAHETERFLGAGCQFRRGIQVLVFHEFGDDGIGHVLALASQADAVVVRFQEVQLLHAESGRTGNLG